MKTILDHPTNLGHASHTQKYKISFLFCWGKNDFLQLKATFDSLPLAMTECFLVYSIFSQTVIIPPNPHLNFLYIYQLNRRIDVRFLEQTIYFNFKFRLYFSAERNVYFFKKRNRLLFVRFL